jgi:hypothetical protein
MYTALKILFISACTISLGLAPLHAVNEDAGTTGFAALKIVYSARAIALGQALTGEARNPDGLFFNPGAIINIEGNEIGSTYTNYFLDAQGGQLQYLYPRNKFIAWGFGLKYMSLGTMDRTEVDQNGDLIETGETFGAYNLIASASMASYVSDAVDVGASVKLIYDQIDDSSASAAVLDLGVIHHPVNKKVKVGLAVRNLGLQLSHYSDSNYKEKLPVTYAAGISYKMNDRLFGCFDLNKATGENFMARLGVEYSLYPSLDLRAGFRSNAGDYNSGGSFGWTSGISLGAGWNWQNYRVDYGLSSYGDLGFVHQLSLTYEF